MNFILPDPDVAIQGASRGIENFPTPFHGPSRTGKIAVLTLSAAQELLPQSMQNECPHRDEKAKEELRVGEATSLFHPHANQWGWLAEQEVSVLHPMLGCISVHPIHHSLVCPLDWDSPAPQMQGCASMVQSNL